MEKFKVGDIVVIKKNFCGHEFEIGELVRIRELDEDGTAFKAEKLDESDWWCVEEKELKKPTRKELIAKINELTQIRL